MFTSADSSLYYYSNNRRKTDVSTDGTLEQNTLIKIENNIILMYNVHFGYVKKKE